MAQFEKGHAKIEGSGAKKGVQMKNKEAKNMIRDFILNKYDNAVEAFDAIDDPKDKFDAYCKLVKFVVPAVSSIQFEESKDASTAVQLLQITAQYKKDK